MTLAAGKRSHVVLETDGPDETEALDAIVAPIEENFGDGRGCDHALRGIDFLRQPGRGGRIRTSDILLPKQRRNDIATR
jgi:hypothetical protein